MIVDDERGAVGVAQVAGGDVDRPLNQFQLGAGHRAGVVEDEGDVDRGAASRAVGRGGRGDPDQQGRLPADGGDWALQVGLDPQVGGGGGKRVATGFIG